MWAFLETRDKFRTTLHRTFVIEDNVIDCARSNRDVGRVRYIGLVTGGRGEPPLKIRKFLILT
jgi:hypothetical protein